MTDLEKEITKLGCVNHDCDVCKSKAQRTWVGLNLDERAAYYEASGGNLSKFADQIEARMKEKNDKN